MKGAARPELTVAVTTCNRADVVDETLASVALQEWDGDWDVVIVDNGSTDETPQILERWLHRMPVSARVVEASDRRGPSFARNTAVAHSTARSIAFVDDDDVIAQGWVAAIGTALRSHEFVGSRLEYHQLNDDALARVNHFQSVRLGRHFGVDVVASGGVGCRRDLWNELGGSDESFRYAEDIDFSLRVAERGGVHPHFCGEAVYHVRLRDGAVVGFRRGRYRGVAEVQLYRRHRAECGARPDALLRAIARWCRLVVQLPVLANPSKRAHWAEQAGRRVGRLSASVRERVWYP